MSTTKHDEIEIQTLVFPDNVRKRIGMYLGDPAQPAKSVSEVVDNGIDEILGGFAKRIMITVPSDGGVVSVVDDGRGVPINEILRHEIKPEIGIEKLRSMHDEWQAAVDSDEEAGLDPLKDPANYNLIQTGNAKALEVWGSLHSSSKFGDDKVSVGLNGVGASCTNATSSSFVGYVNLRKKNVSTMPTALFQLCEGMVHPVYRIEFAAGHFISETVIEYADAPACAHDMGTDFGTAVVFQPDAKIWATTIVDYNMTTLSIARATLPKDTVITYNGEQIAPYSLQDHFSKTEFIHGTVSEVEFDCSVEVPGLGSVIARGLVMFGYSATDFDFRWDGSINTLHTPEGYHIENVRRGIGDAIASKSPALTMADGKNGLRMFTLIFTNRAIYNGQTKEKVVDIKGLPRGNLQATVCRAIQDKIKSDKATKELVQVVVDRLIEYKRTLGNMSLSALVASQIKTSADQKNDRGLGAEVYDCWCKDRSEAELFIVEGKSAGGSLLQARGDAKFHAVLPLRGKPMNTQTRDLEETLDNKEMKSLLNVIGAGITGYGCDPKLARYGKVIFMADEDADGKNILALLIGNTGKFLRELVEAGMFYICDVPLYKQGGKFFRANDGLEQGFDKSKGFDRYKGLGSMDPDEIGMFAFGAERRLIRITAEGLDAAMQMARASGPKRELMYEYGIVLEPIVTELDNTQLSSNVKVSA
jgi:DNA gyrase/topoisomerase IV subunit B